MKEKKRKERKKETARDHWKLRAIPYNSKERGERERERERESTPKKRQQCWPLLGVKLRLFHRI